MTTQASDTADTGAPRHPAHAPACFRDVLALATAVSPWSPALLAAIDVAARWNGHVTGCYVPGCLREQRALEDDPTVLGLLADVDADCLDDAVAFRAFAQERGVHDAHWSVTHTAIAPTLRKLGAWHDLAVIERDMVDETRIFDILGEAMLCSRVPCLVLPPAWSDRLSFQRIVIGWNGSFESTRALHSALPLLQLAGQVTLVNGQARASRTREPDVAEPDPIAYLRQHGVAARAHDLDVPNDEVGKALLHTAHERRADLLVMGGYGRSRIRERVLGGATRHVMAHAGIPVFMQH